MSNLVKRKVKPESKQMWDVMIADAQTKLDGARKRVVGLEKAVKDFTQLRDEGFPWPPPENTSVGEQH